MSHKIDDCLRVIAEEYRLLPSAKQNGIAFREALSRHGLPGGYCHEGLVPRLFADAVKEKNRFLTTEQIVPRA